MALSCRLPLLLLVSRLQCGRLCHHTRRVLLLLVVVVVVVHVSSTQSPAARCLLGCGQRRGRGGVVWWWWWSGVATRERESSALHLIRGGERGVRTAQHSSSSPSPAKPSQATPRSAGRLLARDFQKEESQWLVGWLAGCWLPHTSNKINTKGVFFFFRVVSAYNTFCSSSFCNYLWR